MIWSRDYIRGLLHREDALKAVFELADTWSSRWKESECDFGLVHCEYVVGLYLKYQGEVGNGGHLQFFMNPSGAHAHETLSALRELKFSEILRILSRAVAVFPGAFVPKDSEKRNEVVNSLNDDAIAAFSALDRELFLIDGAHWALVQKYLREHESEILERSA